MVWSLLAASEATMTSKQPRRADLASDLKSVTQITYIFMCILLICLRAHFEGLLVASKITTASEWPQSSNLTSDLEFVAQTTYDGMFVLAA